MVQVPHVSPTRPAGQGRPEAVAMVAQAAAKAKQSTRRACRGGRQSLEASARLIHGQKGSWREWLVNHA